MKREYTIKELCAILGCSRTAIVKKIKEDDNGVKRYKDRYSVVTSNGQMAIVLDDSELEEEKRLSKGVSNISDVIDIEPEPAQVSPNEIYTFAEKYLERFTAFQEESYKELRQLQKERDTFESQVKLLEDNRNKAEEVFFKTEAENKTLKKRNKRLLIALGVITGVLICFITFHITFVAMTPRPDTPEEIERQKKELVSQEVQLYTVQPVKQAKK